MALIQGVRGKPHEDGPLTDWKLQLGHLRYTVLATRAGMVAERVVRAFWPVWTIFFFALAPMMLGWLAPLPIEAVWAFAVLCVLTLAIALYVGIRRFHWPSDIEALARVDERLKGRPIAALLDQQAIGASDPASAAIWSAHLERMRVRTSEAKTVEPDLRIARLDPFGLRYTALLFFVIALLFGSIWRVGDVVQGRLPSAGATASATWEAWVAPPSYTGVPSIYLADITAPVLSVPQGSTVTIRLYGDVGDLTVLETVSARTSEIGSASDLEQSFEITQSGTIEIQGNGGRVWRIEAKVDQEPYVELTAPVSSDAKGQMSQAFRALDDYGVVRGSAEIALDLSRVDRRFGLAASPDEIAPIKVDLPMPYSGGRDDFDNILTGDFSESVLANLPVTITLSVEDARGQIGLSDPEEIILPGKRFFQPLAKAIAEQRRDILWSSTNAKQSAQLLRAITYKPEGFITDNAKFLRLRFIVQRIEGMIEDGVLDDAERIDVTDALWDLAIEFEEGSLQDARERLERAQERLAEAMRNGASPEEIQELMDELRDATNDYMDLLAEQNQGENGTDQPDQSQQSTEITQDELNALMDRIQELMEEGRMAEAQALMDQLNQMLENMQVAEGQASGQSGQAQRAMRDLGQTLQDQQELSDDSFSKLQEQFNGQQGQGEDGDSLADRQQSLTDQLENQRQSLPNLQGEAGGRAERNLEQAGRSMQEAEQALRDGNLPEAIDKQAEAMDRMREGLRDMGQALAEAEQSQTEQAEGQQSGDQQGAVPQPTRRDPLGRESGAQGGINGEGDDLGMNVERRAQELLDELRKRSSDQERPRIELDYLKRLLDRF